MTRQFSRRSLLKGAGVVAAGAMASPYVLRSAKGAEKLVVYNGWGGTYDEHMFQAFFTPFEKATGFEVQAVKPQTLSLMKKQVSTGTYQFDFADYNIVKATQATSENLLEKVDFSIVDKSKLSAPALEGALKVNGIEFSLFSTNVVYNKKKFPNGGPQSWTDFWDVSKFPGTRALIKRADLSVVAALLADGVPADKIYPLDLDRAFKKLDEIKPHLKIIWSGGNQGMQLLRDGEVDMSAMYGGRAWQLVDEGVPLEVVWNGAVFTKGYWIVARGSPRSENAWRLIDFAYAAERQAKFAELTNYGPMHPEAFDYLSKAQAKRLPSYPPNFSAGVIQQPLDNLSEVTKRFTQWMAA